MMNRLFLVVLCLVTLSNVQLGQSQCDGEVQHQNAVIQQGHRQSLWVVLATAFLSFFLIKDQ